MTFLEAAEAILRKEKRPLHYREIAQLAIDSGLIDTKGKTPDATMGAILYQHIKRATKIGEPGRFRNAGRGKFALVETGRATGIERGITDHNRGVRSELLDFLRQMHPRQLELLVGQLLAAIGFEDIEVTRYVGDYGIDVDAILTVGGVTKVRTAIQVKRYATSNAVGPSVVRELRGSLVSDQRGLIITTSRFTGEAVAEGQAAGKVPISLIDGARLAELLTEYDIGVLRRPASIYELNLVDIVIAGDAEDGTGDKSAALWPLPGGQDAYFDTLLAFLDKIAADTPTIDEMTDWVFKKYEKVTKQTVVQSCLRTVLYNMGLIEFDGERVVLSDDGEKLQRDRSKNSLLGLLKQNILGVEEILEILATGSLETKTIHEALVKRLALSWETEIQTRHRLNWLAACGAIEKRDKMWATTENKLK